MISVDYRRGQRPHIRLPVKIFDYWYISQGVYLSHANKLKLYEDVAANNKFVHGIAIIFIIGEV